MLDTSLDQTIQQESSAGNAAPHMQLTHHLSDKSLMRVLLLVVVASWMAHAAGPPEVSKVEPPNWWIGHSWNPVRIMIRGANLTGARVETDGAGIYPGEPWVNSKGTYVFVDLMIDRGARAGPVSLRLTTASGTAHVPFTIQEPLSREGRFGGFSPDDLIYLIMPDRFANGDRANDDPPRSRGLLDRSKPRYYHGGDLAGIIERLPYFKELGVTAIWLNPIYDNSDRLDRMRANLQETITDYHGYGSVDFYAVEEHFGDLATAREVVDAAHGLGINVILDQVANHTGPRHPWVADPPTPTWFNGTAGSHLSNAWQTWTLADPHSTAGMRQATLEGWFAGMLPDLNQGDREVARYLIQNTLWWIGSTGIDGIREDTVPYVPRAFWRDWMAAIKREYPEFQVVGEVLERDPALVAFFQGGRPQFDGLDSGIDTLFDFPLYYAVRRVFGQGQSMRELATTLGQDHLYPNPGSLITFLGLHDVSRFMGEPDATVEGLKLAFTFLMTTRGIPLIYYGDELGMPGGADPDNRRDFPGGWPADPRDAFHAKGRTESEESIFRHIQHLAHLRDRLAPLRRGKLLHLFVSEQAYVYARVLGSDVVIVALNNGAAPATTEFELQELPLPDGAVLHNALGGAPSAQVVKEKARLSLPARSAGVYRTAARP
jgi:neopullulanase